MLCCVVQAQTLRTTDLSYCTTVPTNDSKHVLETQRQGLSPHRPVADIHRTESSRHWGVGMAPSVNRLCYGMDDRGIGFRFQED